MIVRLVAAMFGVGLAVSLTAGGAQANLVTNGNFLSSSNGDGQLGYNTTVTGWTVPDPNPPDFLSYTFLFSPGVADNGTGVTGIYGNVGLWGSKNYGWDNIDVPIPGNGNYLGQDGAFQVGAISQMINGLTPGAAYALSFAWAAAQQQWYYGPTTENWTADFGSQSETTPTIGISNQSFSGWQSASFTFTADSTSDLLSFFATGTPTGAPPFALLTDVSLNTEVPEPASIVIFGFAVISLGAVVWRQRKKGQSTRRAAEP